MNRRWLFFLFFLSTFSFAAITGTAFKDYNADGIKQAGEPGVGGVIVKAYKDEGAGSDSLIAQTTTNSDGNYSLDTGGIFPIRLEFELPSNNECGVKKGIEFPSAGGVNYGTNIQFAKADKEIHNFALSYPYDFSTQDNPYVFTTIFANRNPLSGGNTGEVAGVVKFHFKDHGHAANSGRGSSDGPAWTQLVPLKWVGSLDGLAYSRQANKLFAAAYLKRHMGLGPLGGGGIYIIDPDPSKNSAESVKFLNLDALGFPTSDTNGTYTDAHKPGTDDDVLFSSVIGSNSHRGLPKDKNTSNHDSAAYDQVGKLSLGDLEISDDGRYLYVVNLYDRKIYQIDLSNPFHPVAPTKANAATKIKALQVPDVCTELKEGEYRPFGMKVYKDRVFIGVVCSGEDATGNKIADSNADMKGTVLSIGVDKFNDPSSVNPSDWKTEVPKWSFDYRNNDGSGLPWFVWGGYFHSLETNNNHEDPVPIIGDIEFNNQGDMLISIRDIQADRLGNLYRPISDKGEATISAGDLIFAKKVKNGGVCSYHFDTSAKEFYNDNYKHPESSGGQLAGHHTSEYDSVLSLFMDPIDVYAYGVMLYNNKDGSKIQEGYEVELV